MTDFLTSLGALSLGGAAAALALAAAGRLFGRRFTARWRCWAWLLLCLRLAVPLSPSVPAARPPIQLPAPTDRVLLTPAEAQPPAASRPVPDRSGTQAAPPPAAQLPAASDPERPPLPGLTLSQAVFSLWLGVAVLILAWSLWGHLRFLRYLRRWSAPVSNREVLELYERTGAMLGLRRLPRLVAVQGLEVPMLAGALRPALLLPRETISEKPLFYSLLHELTHCRRRDILLKALALWAAALHWFNPAVWLMLRWVERDTELACDDAAARLLPEEERAAYGQTILAAVERLQRRNNLS